MATGRHPYRLFARMALACPGVQIALIDDVPVAALGCTNHGDHGSPWLLGTPGIEGMAAGRALLRDGSMMMEQWAAEYGLLSNHAYAENAVHIRYLKALGCTLRDPRPYGPLQRPFMEFIYV